MSRPWGLVRRRPGLGLLDLLRAGTDGLRTRRTRAALSCLGIVVGVATVLLVTGIPASSQQALEQRLSAMGADLLRLDPVQSGDEPRTLPADARAMLDRVGPVTGAAVVANLHQPVRSNAHRLDGDGALTPLAVDGDLLRLVRGTLGDGTFVPGGSEPVAVLGSEAAERLGIHALPERDVQIDVGGVDFVVVGILDPTPLAVDLQSAVLVGWEAAEAWLDFDGHPTVAYATVREDRVAAVRSVLAATVSPEVPGVIQVSRPSDVLASKEASRETFDGLFLGLAAVALLVGGIGIANTMFSAVHERRREVGLRRALGAQRRDVLLQFLLEATVLCSAGGLTGALVGATACSVWATARGWPVVLPVEVVVGSVAATFVTGVLAGIQPALRAARLSPTAALGSE